MYRFACDEEIDLDELRTRLPRMTDDDLLRPRFGKAAQFMGRDKIPRHVFVVQLDKARAEGRWRQPRKAPSTGNVARLPTGTRMTAL